MHSYLGASLLDGASSDIDLACEKLKVQVKVLFHHSLQVSTGEQSLEQVIMDESIIGIGNSPSSRMTLHYPLPHRMRRKAETDHFEGIPLLTSLGALNMVEFRVCFLAEKCFAALCVPGQRLLAMQDTI